MFFGLFGSIAARVEREVRQHQQINKAARRARGSPLLRALKFFLGVGSISRFLTAYFLVNLACLAIEVCVARLAPGLLNPWTKPDSGTDVGSFLTVVAGYAVSAQATMLGLLSMAVGLVAFVASRESASTDVRVYYHQAMVLELVSSSLALLIVLCIQLGWPLQFVAHEVGLGAPHLVFKLALLALHMIWLVINLLALAHFARVTFLFVQPGDRAFLRETYTANALMPRELRTGLRQSAYASAGETISSAFTTTHNTSAVFGYGWGRDEATEIAVDFSKPCTLTDVWLTPLAWTLGRWEARCRKAATGTSTEETLTIFFSLNIDQRLSGRVEWCKRKGGLPLTTFERTLIGHCFRFKRIADER